MLARGSATRVADLKQEGNLVSTVKMRSRALQSPSARSHADDPDIRKQHVRPRALQQLAKEGLGVLDAQQVLFLGERELFSIDIEEDAALAESKAII